LHVDAEATPRDCRRPSRADGTTTHVPACCSFPAGRIGVHRATYAAASTASAIFLLAVALRRHPADDPTG
jgi:hypothetical protein